MLSERAFESMRPLVTALTIAIQPYIDRPYALFGHSMGALVSFELVRLLQRIGMPPPGLLIVSGRAAPHLPSRQRLSSIATDRQIVELLRSLGGTPDVLLREQEWLDLALPAIRADLLVCDTYIYTPDEPLVCPIAALLGDGDPFASREDVEEWRNHTSSSFSFRLLAGGHFYFEADPKVLTQVLEVELSQLLTTR